MADAQAVRRGGREMSDMKPDSPQDKVDRHAWLTWFLILTRKERAERMKDMPPMVSIPCVGRQVAGRKHGQGEQGNG
jgi:hypothetical protein